MITQSRSHARLSPWSNRRMAATAPGVREAKDAPRLRRASGRVSWGRGSSHVVMEDGNVIGGWRQDPPAKAPRSSREVSSSPVGIAAHEMKEQPSTSMYLWYGLPSRCDGIDIRKWRIGWNMARTSFGCHRAPSQPVPSAGSAEVAAIYLFGVLDPRRDARRK